MSPKILSGIEAREHIIPGLKKRSESFSAAPQLVILQIGDRPDSAAYIRAKISFAHKIGALARHIHLPETVSEEEVVDQIRKLNDDVSVQGIIVQLPLPKQLSGLEGAGQKRIIEAIDPSKDVDGLTSYNASLLEKNDSRAIVPATARGVFELLDHYGILVKGKKVTVVGRSSLVGRPIARVLAHREAIVTVAHSKTADLAKETASADIVVVAVGKPGLITDAHVREGQAIIDVGINDVGGRKLVGDVDFEKVSAKIGSAGALSPVPGGVGPMTVLGLFENLIDAASSQNGQM